ncbi:MAG: hypothetical protein Q9220_006972 [cf. Caloplaca sp. 1 TL-2023]
MPDSEQIGHTVIRARQTFGDTLPRGFLSNDEYKVYQRLYGPPLGVTQPKDIGLLHETSQNVNEEHDDVQNDIFREDADGNLERIAYAPTSSLNPEDINPEAAKDPDETTNSLSEALEGKRNINSDFDERFATYRDEIIAQEAVHQEVGAEMQDSLNDETTMVEKEDQEIIEEPEKMQDHEEPEPFEESESAYANDEGPRRHPLTSAGKWGPNPTTVQLPKDTLVDPIAAILSEASNKHLTEISLKLFGGKGLPNSTATPTPKIAEANLKQSPIALEASQTYMGEMEANAYLAAIIPGAYTATLSCLVEVQNRLGSQWIRGLLRQEGGPRILDAGAGGAGVLAWREMLRNEWESMHPEADMEKERIPFGKSTVVTGSATLRQRSSMLLDNTTFLPRLPDYNPSVDHVSAEQGKGTSRKQYDVIIAPYTLWTFQEDHMRKAHIHNLWSLLNPDGGVLVVVEKGIPRGFELVAGAREVLLKYHIASPGDTKYENRVDEPSEGRYRDKEKGMIIAPCTNHGKCPMYLFSGKSVGRSDYCHFSQRYIRPPFLQRIVGQNHRNHEDIRFSFVAVQRGIDQRQVHGIQQGQKAEDAAFAGYGHMVASQVSGEDQTGPSQDAKAVASDQLPINPLSFPRIMYSPLKKRGHIIFDACTPAGKLERWTVPRSYSKQAYADARKARWGDLWALGAKTRIPRRLRIGREAIKPRSRQRNESHMSDPDSIRGAGRSPRAVKSFKRMRKPSHKKNPVDIDIEH